jgi:glycine cleavage system H protein
MGSSEVKTDRRYTKDHEWAKDDGGVIVIGITAFGDITLVNLDVKPGEAITAGKAFGTIESVKTLSDLFAPVSGTIERVNGDLENKPELVNEDCWEKAWMIALKPTDAAELQKLLDDKAYAALLETAAH